MERSKWPHLFTSLALAVCFFICSNSCLGYRSRDWRPAIASGRLYGYEFPRLQMGTVPTKGRGPCVLGITANFAGQHLHRKLWQLIPFHYIIQYSMGILDIRSAPSWSSLSWCIVSKVLKFRSFIILRPLGLTCGPVVQFSLKDMFGGWKLISMFPVDCCCWSVLPIWALTLLCGFPANFFFWRWFSFWSKQWVDLLWPHLLSFSSSLLLGTLPLVVQIWAANLISKY